MTPNIQAISASSIESGSGPLISGFETLWAIVLRSAFQRSFNAKGSHCVQKIVSPTTIGFLISDSGAKAGFIFAYAQLIITLLSFIAFLPWLFSQVPIGPAIRLSTDKTYLMAMLGTLNSGALLGHVNGVSETNEIWATYDFNVRVGESVSSRDDPDLGTIVMEKPKFVTELSYVKRYV